MSKKTPANAKTEKNFFNGENQTNIPAPTNVLANAILLALANTIKIHTKDINK